MIFSRTSRGSFLSLVFLSLSGTVLFTGCFNPIDGSPINIPPIVIVGDSSGSTQGSPSPSPSPSPSSTPTEPTQKIDALLFNGKGVWADEVASLKNILSSHGASFQEVTSDELDRMSLDELSQFKMLIFPGGGGSTQANSLGADTHARLRAVVQERGVSYIGFCAGAFIAVAPAPEAGKDVSYGLGIVDGPILDYYYLENQGKLISMTLESFADGTKRDLVWYGGPVTPNASGGVVAKYPNGDPAITQIWSGKGFVMLSAIHPAAPQRIRDLYGLRDSDGLDYDLTWKLLDSTMNQRPLQAF